MGRVSVEPIDEFLLMSEFAIIGIVAVQKYDSNNIIGNFFNRIQITEDKTSAAAVAIQNYLDVVGLEQLFHAPNDLRDQSIAIFFPPCGPALQTVFEIYYDNRLLRKERT